MIYLFDYLTASILRQMNKLEDIAHEMYDIEYQDRNNERSVGIITG